MYPNSDSTNSDIKKVLFPVGVTSFNEDFQTSENFREQEEIARFNSIVKTPGIASRKRSMNNNYLFPSPITGNQISITSGTGYTPNGARIELPATISITNITTLPGYQAPASNNRVYLVLRKVLQEYQNRSHPITGDQKTTRQRLKTDNTIVEFIVTGLPLSQLDAPDLVTDKDVLIIGRLSSISPVTFDTTEKTGGRRILRSTQDAALELSGGIMEGNIDGNDQYSFINTPQWGKVHYNQNGSVHNRDFHRLFSRVNHTLAILRDIEFKQSSGNWGLKLGNNDTVKFSIIPSQRPPVKFDIVSSDSFIAIPENHVLYLELQDTNVLLTSGNQPINQELDSNVLNNFLKVSNFLTSNNIGTGSGNTLLRFPIAWHHVDQNTGVRRLIFANGMSLRENEAIDSNGKYNGYVRRDGGSIMIGDLIIQKNSAAIALRRTSSTVLANQQSGIVWQSSSGQITSARMVRIDQLSSSTGIGQIDSLPISEQDSVGDIFLEVSDNSGNNSKLFKFKYDGRLKVPTAPIDDDDVARKVELDTKLSLEGGVVNGDVLIIGLMSVRGETPKLIIQDTVPSNTSQEIGIYRNDSIDEWIGRFRRFSERDGPNYPYQDGDFIWETRTSALQQRSIVVHSGTRQLLSAKNIGIDKGILRFNELTVAGSPIRDGFRSGLYERANDGTNYSLIYVDGDSSDNDRISRVINDSKSSQVAANNTRTVVTPVAGTYLIHITYTYSFAYTASGEGGRIALVLSESSGPTTIRTFTDTFYMDTHTASIGSTNRTVTFTAVANLGEAVTVQSVATPTVIVGAPNVTPVLHQIDVILLR